MIEPATRAWTPADAHDARERHDRRAARLARGERIAQRAAIAPADPEQPRGARRWRPRIARARSAPGRKRPLRALNAHASRTHSVACAVVLAAGLVMSAAIARGSDFSARLDAAGTSPSRRSPRRASRRRCKQYAANSREALEIATQVARAQGLQRRFDAAHATLDAHRAGARARGCRACASATCSSAGASFNSSGAVTKAVPLFRQAAEVAKRAGRDGDAFYEIDALHMLGIAAPAAEQLDWNLRALVAAEGATDARARAWLGSLYHNIGWTWFERGEHGQALDYWEKALHVREAAGDAARLTRRALDRRARLPRDRPPRRRRAPAARAASRTTGAAASRTATSTRSWPRSRWRAASATRRRRGPPRPTRCCSDDAWLAATEPARLKRLAELGASAGEGGAPATGTR